MAVSHEHSHDVDCCPRLAPTYAVICPVHGQMTLTEAEYMRQLNKPNELWQCPTCDRVAKWDDSSTETCAV